MVVAAIDVGSNSVLLLIQKRENGILHTLFESSEVTGLGEGTKETGLLSEPAIRKTLRCLRDCFEVAKAHGAEKILAAGTMALRIAQNTEDFLRQGEKQGTPVLVLSGEEEAELGFKAVALDPQFKYLTTLSIVDPGGHSTEVVTCTREGASWRTLFKRSYPIGTLALRGSLLQEEMVEIGARLAAVKALDDTIGLCYLPDKAGEVVVLGAAGTNLVSVRDRLLTWQPEKVHGATLNYEEISKMAGWLMDLTDEGRARVPGLEPGRERTIHIGALILERFLHALRVDFCHVSVRGWRHALLEKTFLEGSIVTG